MEIRIGTSGWHYKHWVGRYYPEKMKPAEMLAWYVRDFDTVEVNNSFYHLPTRETFEEWREATPENFLFVVKGSRYITHMKKLGDPQAGLARFVPNVEGLGDKLGPILWQLPPMWKCNVERLESFLAALPTAYRHAFEFRNHTWHVPEVYAALRRHNAAFCPYDLAGFQAPVEITADFTYIRLHGPDGAYAGTYTREALQAWADRLRAWQGELAAVYVYFDNDWEACAVRDALALKELAAFPSG